MHVLLALASTPSVANAMDLAPATAATAFGSVGSAATLLWYFASGSIGLAVIQTVPVVMDIAVSAVETVTDEVVETSQPQKSKFVTIRFCMFLFMSININRRVNEFKSFRIRGSVARVKF